MIVGARNGISASMAIRGAPGIGKTALLRDATRRLNGVGVLRCDGYEAEWAMPYSALQRAMMPLARHVAALPPRHQQALRVAAGQQEGPPPDKFLVGLGVLETLDWAGREEPLVLVVDDAQWLDEESLDVLAFVARRLKAERVALLLALRDEPSLEVKLAGIPSRQLDGLDVESSVKLLASSLTDVIDPVAARQIATATGGNPLALIDLAQDLTVQQLTDTAMASEPIPIGRNLEAHYVRQVRMTSPQVQSWLLVAAAESTGNPDLISRASAALGLADDAGAAAEKAGLVMLDATVAFRHPLVRSAVYGAAIGSDRRTAHAALARAADELDLTELEAWHAAKATFGTDPDVADRLERVADRAGARGGFGSRASVLARAADVTPPGTVRHDRLISAAEAAAAAGAAYVTYALLDRIDPAELDVVQKGRMTATRSSLAAFMADPNALVWATANMLQAAGYFHGVEPELEQTALLRAFEYALPVEWLMQGVTLHELGARLEQGAEVAAGPAAAVLRGLSAHILLPYADAVPLMRAAVDALMDLDDRQLLPFGPVSVALTTALWDERSRDECLQRIAAAARDAGSLQVLDTALWILSIAELSGGNPRRAGQYVEQVRELRRAVGYEAELVVNVAYLAWVGAPRVDVETIAEATLATGFGGVYTSAITALAIRDLAEGHYRDAYERLRSTLARPFLQVTYLQLPDYVEAAVRCGHPEDTVAAVQDLTVMARASGSAWVESVAERSLALIESDAEAEPHYQRAIEALHDSDLPVELARAHLVYGEWLRRLKRRREAREHLSAALDIFERVEAPPFAARARAELAATGVHLDEREPRRQFDLTPQEAAVADLGAAGHTNVEIGATLFISANTVDYHLRKVFQKLGISSRRQLAERLDSTS